MVNGRREGSMPAAYRHDEAGEGSSAGARGKIPGRGVDMRGAGPLPCRAVSEEPMADTTKKTKIDLKARLGKTTQVGMGPPPAMKPLPGVPGTPPPPGSDPAGSAAPPSSDGVPRPPPSSAGSRPPTPMGIAPPPGLSQGIPL